MTKAINAALLRNMIISAANKLNENKGYVDSLNVFPVPDGDTGTNMSLTFMSAAREVSDKDFDNACDVASVVAKATLRGARGNSGVILSQIFRGISKGSVSLSELCVADFALAMQKGSDTAYRAVMKPTEGTILTVIRKMAKAAMEYQGDDFEGFFAHVNKKGKIALDKTPELLPQLKQAGVVDAGGRGLLFIFEGMANALSMESVSLNDSQNTPTGKKAANADESTFTYCAEFVIEKYNDSMNTDSMKRKIAPIGERMAVEENGMNVKVSIHTNNPGFVLEQGVKLGQLFDVKIENLQKKNQATNVEKVEEAPMPHRDLAVISVAAGDGITQTFTQLGVSYVISGGQTMNPSTDDILAAIDKVNADNVIILPNNKNIILASEQAKKLAKEVNVSVIQSKTIPQGITAMINFMPDASLDDNSAAMADAITTVKSGSVTHAVRNSSFEGLEIHEGDYLGLLENKINVTGDKVGTTLLNLLANMADEDSEIITVYNGSDVSDSDAAEIVKVIEDSYPDCDVILKQGGQPVYYYLISVE